MIKGQAIKTKSDPTLNGGGFFVYDKPNGTYLGALPTANVIGFFVEEKNVGSVSWTHVKLLQKLKAKYTYAWIPTNNIYTWEPRIEYIIAAGRTGVNIRTEPSLTSSVIKKQNAGQSVGKTDGFSVGDFYFFNLTSGGYGWVSKTYVQVLANPTGETSTGKNPTGLPTGTPTPTPEPKGNPLTQYAGPAVIILSCILLLTLVRYAVKFSE